jgi:hypothetical protein
MTDLGLHIKALDLLIAYSESEQYDPCMDALNILMTNQMILAELRYMREHIKNYHEGIRAMELHDMIRRHIEAVNTDDKNLRAEVYCRDGWG